MSRYANIDDQSNNFSDLFGDWKPDSNQNQIHQGNNKTLPDLKKTYSNLERDWVADFNNQIRDLENLMDENMTLVTKNYLDRKVTIACKNIGTFVVEMLKRHEGEDTLENNVYVKDQDIPIYTENITDRKSEIIGNFWLSFVEHGLPQYTKLTSLSTSI